MRIWQLRDYSKPAWATVNRRAAGLLLGRAVLSARRDHCRTQSSSRVALRAKAHARITFRAWLALRVQRPRLRRWPSLTSPSRSPADAFRAYF
jgi:hypothetical protein